MNHIEVKNLHVRYGPYEVLSDITFSIPQGDFLAIVGPNGSGKTTLVKTIVGLMHPASGSIHMGGAPISQAGTSVGYLPQKSSYTDPRFPATVREVIRSGLMSRSGSALRSSRTRSDDSVETVLKLLQIDSLADKRVGKLSGGQQQRVHLARALVGNPSLLVLDEPTGALDPHTRECFYTTLLKYNSQQGVTIIIVTHDSHSIGQYASSLLFIDRKILFFGSMEEYNRTPSSDHYFNHNHAPGEGAPC